MTSINSPAQRLTALARNAADLLRVNGFAWGPAVATGTQLTLTGALDRTSEIAGDTYVIEREFVRHKELDEIEQGAAVLPDPFAAGAAEAHVDYLSRLEITDADLLDHFGVTWRQVLALNTALVALPFETWLARAGVLAPVKTEQRNQAWVAVRDHAQKQGRFLQWRDSLELVSAYFQTYLTYPERAPSSPAVWTAWSAAETIGRDAMAVAALDEHSPDAVLAAQLSRLIAPWRAVNGRTVTGSHSPRVSTSPATSPAMVPHPTTTIPTSTTMTSAWKTRSSTTDLGTAARWPAAAPT